MNYYLNDFHRKIQVRIKKILSNRQIKQFLFLTRKGKITVSLSSPNNIFFN